MDGGRAAAGKRMLRLAAASVLLCGTGAAIADANSQGTGNPNATLSASSQLDFNLNIDKFLFFRVGSTGYPTASATIDTVSISSAPSIPPGAVTPADGNGIAVNWNGSAPTVAINNPTLPVEVRSNAGQISIKANVVTALTSGANSIPLSQITVNSDDANLPAPLIPNSGAGASVNVTGTAFSNLVTVRSANWTFGFSPPTQPPAGTYTGQISFTASSP
jgi:hypothetical protein